MRAAIGGARHDGRASLGEHVMKRALLLTAILTATLFPAIGLASDDASPAALTAFVKAAKGAKKIRTFAGTLESPKADIFPVKKGYCYLVVLKLGKGATLERKSIGMDWPNSSGEQQPSSFGAELEGDTGAVFKPDCATAKADVGAWVGLQTFDGLKAIGKGPFTLEVFERKGTKKELAAEAAADSAFHEESAKERQAQRSKTCGECSSPNSGRKVCLERRGVTMSDCGW